MHFGLIAYRTFFLALFVIFCRQLNSSMLDDSNLLGEFKEIAHQNRMMAYGGYYSHEKKRSFQNSMHARQLDLQNANNLFDPRSSKDRSSGPSGGKMGIKAGGNNTSGKSNDPSSRMFGYPSTDDST